MKKVILIPSYEPDELLINLVYQIDKKKFDIVVIDDGSGKDYQNVFQLIKKDVHLISYQTNMGKGYALKKGYEYIKNHYQEDYLVITMDSDGQHRIEDAIKLLDYVENNPHILVLGMRKRSGKTPLRSRIGNGITKFVFRLVSHLNIYDTQTGLRCFSYELMDFMLSIPGNRYEYEMNVLLNCSKNNIKVHEIEIETIYIDNNSRSHFNAIKDSIRIYKDILKFSLSSIISFIIDFSLFSVFSIFIKKITICNILARIISATVNYILNRKFVFQSNKSVYKSFFSYVLLAILILVLNTLLLNMFVNYLYINRFVAKIIVEFILFIFNYFIQKKVIFKRNI